ncbi:hypothetical protein HCX50_04080 [Microbacterium oxydans]|uniref:hypothetical protein n=1 Tax=Microbacterium sp. B19(2022) TaxID=2914045 RepID=UPI00143203B4|nr:hypothetical protein [Microbacterium sp. B19(2022)]NJI58605.1 hypothetical protein [Microbacterium sp. B19(2022)]
MTTARDTHQTLGRLVQAVAAAVDDQPRCVEAVALLVALAKQFGIELQPRAVSLVGQDRRRPDRIVVTGRMAQDFVASHGGSRGGAEVVAASPDGSEFQRAGHLIAVYSDADPGFLLDPSFGQFVRAGLPDTVVVDAFEPGEPDWRVDIGDSATVLYLMDPTNSGWQDAFRSVAARSDVAAAEIASHLRAGGQPHTHGVVLAPRSPR